MVLSVAKILPPLADTHGVVNSVFIKQSSLALIKQREIYRRRIHLQLLFLITLLLNVAVERFVRGLGD